ncbi:MAG: peptide-methionine (S)-S-oxide reductase MsrA [archaeon]|nr:peptide-methionine (S)-S-oxide reductase MsrA [archaeon]
MQKFEKATFGGGCFWGIEEAFRTLKGVKSATSGYMGGKIKNPTYEQVCADNTAHVEVVQIEFDPKEISYEQLVTGFWSLINPTTTNRQGFDIGSQYRSVIFYHSEEQKKIAQKSKEELEKSGKYKNKMVTAIEPAKEFFPAEEYHQKYYLKQGMEGKQCNIF